MDTVLNVKSQTIRNTSYWIGCILIIIIGIIAIFSNVLFFFIFGDEGYQALCARNPLSSPIAAGTFYIGHVFTQLFGDSLISLRFLSKICYIFTIGISCLYFNSKTDNPLVSSIIFLILGVCSTISGFYIFNWDTMAYPFEAIGLILLLNYNKKPKYSNIIFCGIACGLMSYVRFPLIITSILYLATIIYAHRNSANRISTIIKHCIVGILSCVFILLLCAKITYGSLSSYFGSFISENFINGHGMDNIGGILWKANYLIPYIFISGVPTIFSFILANFYRKISVHKTSFIIISLIFTTFSYWMIVRLSVVIGWGYDNTIYGLPFPFFYLPFLLIFYYKYFRSHQFPHSLIFNILIIFLFYLAEGFGSDTPYERLNISFAFPILLATIYSSIDQSIKESIFRWLYISAVSLTIICFLKVKFIYKYSEKLDNNPEHLEYLSFASNETDIWKNLMTDIKMIDDSGFKREDILFWGTEKYSPTYVFQKHPKANIQHFHMKDGDITKVINTSPKFIFMMNTNGYIHNKSIDLLLNNYDFSIVRTTPYYILLESNHTAK